MDDFVYGFLLPMVSDSRCGVRRNATPRAAVVLSPAWRAALRDLTVAFLLVASVLWPTAVELAASWQRNGAYHYAWLVVPMFVYLVGWHFRAQILAELPLPDVAGVIVAVVAAVGWSIAAAANIDIGRQVALLMVFQGLALAALGRQLYRRLLPVMALLFLMLPSADLLVGPLRWLTVKAIEWLALASGMPYRSDGFLLHVGENSYLVLEACAGLAHVTLMLFLGYCFALLVFRAMYKIVAIALFAAALGVLSNVLRVYAIIWIDRLRGIQMDLAAHGRVQWAALLIVLALLFYGMLRMRAEATGPALSRARRVAPPTPPPASMRRASLVAGVAVLAVVGPTRVLLDDDGAPLLVVSMAAPPTELAGWELESPAAEWTEAGELRSLALRYGGAGRPLLGITLVETRVAGAKLPPQRGLHDGQAGWRDVVSEPIDACDGTDCVRLVHSLWKNDEAHVVRHIYYSYSIGGFETPSRLLVRLATAAVRLAGSRDAARLVAFSVDGDALEPGELLAMHRAIEAMLRDAGSTP